MLIPESYVADLGVRLGLYRRIASLVDKPEIEAFAAELIDRFGPLPPEVENLLEIIAIKRSAARPASRGSRPGRRAPWSRFRDNRFAKPAELVDFINRKRDEVSLRPDHKLVWRQDWRESGHRVAGVQGILAQLAKIAA